jgi:hypothetical protein
MQKKKKKNTKQSEQFQKSNKNNRWKSQNDITNAQMTTHFPGFV